MAKCIIPKATTAARQATIPVAGELLYDKDEKRLYYGDGVTQGGVPVSSDDSETPSSTN